MVLELGVRAGTSVLLEVTSEVVDREGKDYISIKIIALLVPRSESFLVCDEATAVPTVVGFASTGAGPALVFRGRDFGTRLTGHEGEEFLGIHPCLAKQNFLLEETLAAWSTKNDSLSMFCL